MLKKPVSSLERLLARSASQAQDAVPLDRIPQLRNTVHVEPASATSHDVNGPWSTPERNQSSEAGRACLETILRDAIAPKWMTGVPAGLRLEETVERALREFKKNDIYDELHRWDSPSRRLSRIIWPEKVAASIESASFQDKKAILAFIASYDSLDWTCKNLLQEDAIRRAINVTVDHYEIKTAADAHILLDFIISHLRRNLHYPWCINIKTITAKIERLDENLRADERLCWQIQTCVDLLHPLESDDPDYCRSVDRLARSLVMGRQAARGAVDKVRSPVHLHSERGRRIIENIFVLTMRRTFYGWQKCHSLSELVDVFGARWCLDPHLICLKVGDREKFFSKLARVRDDQCWPIIHFVSSPAFNTWIGRNLVIGAAPMKSVVDRITFKNADQARLAVEAFLRVCLDGRPPKDRPDSRLLLTKLEALPAETFEDPSVGEAIDALLDALPRLELALETSSDIRERCNALRDASSAPSHPRRPATAQEIANALAAEEEASSKPVRQEIVAPESFSPWLEAYVEEVHAKYAELTRWYEASEGRFNVSVWQTELGPSPGPEAPSQVDALAPSWVATTYANAEKISHRAKRSICLDEVTPNTLCHAIYAHRLSVALSPLWLAEGRRSLERLPDLLMFYRFDDGIVQKAAMYARAPELLGFLSNGRSLTAPTKSWRARATTLLNENSKGILGSARRWLETFADPIVTQTNYTRILQAQMLQAKAHHLKPWAAAIPDPKDAAFLSLVGGRLSSDDGLLTHLARWQKDSASNFRSPYAVSDANEVILKGLVWLMALDGANADVSLILRVAKSCLIRLGGGKLRSHKGANACIWALGEIGTKPAVVALAHLRLKLQDERIRKSVDKALAATAQRAGLTAEELEEISVDDYGLDAGGRLETEVAGYPVELAVESGTKAAVTIRTPDGRAMKSVPLAIKRDPEALKELKGLEVRAKEISSTLPMIRMRFERTWLTNRTWTAYEFEERIRDHPLVSWFASCLIWTVTAEDGRVRSMMIRDGRPFAADGAPVDEIGPRETVSLWHPIDAAADEVAAWRAFLMRERITQPIKQAHRELHRLTTAETRTETYSNRFAGHIIRQHQSMALAKLQGWSARHRMWQDVPNDEPTHIRIPTHGLVAEFWTQGAGGDNPEVTEATAYVFLQTDRVIFRRLTDDGGRRREGGRTIVQGEIIPLADVPPRVLSEVMRDVDLMVTLSSIGNDPTWVDQGAQPTHLNAWRQGEATDYFNRMNTAELTVAASARRDFLLELVPTLAFADRITVDDKHLVVEGKLHTYRIHIGSGGIFMEPSGTYLCIVPATSRPGAGQIFLPFDGDWMLSLILSKAQLLAADDKIRDESIVRQIRR